MSNDSKNDAGGVPLHQIIGPPLVPPSVAPVDARLTQLDEEIRLGRFADKVHDIEARERLGKRIANLQSRNSALERQVHELRHLLRDMLLNGANATLPLPGGEPAEASARRGAALGIARAGLGRLLCLAIAPDSASPGPCDEHPPESVCRAPQSLTVDEALSGRFRFSAERPFRLATTSEGVCVHRLADGACEHGVDRPRMCQIQVPGASLRGVPAPGDGPQLDRNGGAK